MTIYKFLLSSDSFIIILIIVAHIGALLGELKKQFDNEKQVSLYKFCVSWFGSSFLSIAIAILLKSTIAKDNNNFAIGTCIICSFIGIDKLLPVLYKIVEKLLNNICSKGE